MTNDEQTTKLKEAVSLLATNRQEALSRIYTFSVSQIYGYIRRRVDTQQVAEDITSNVYLELMRIVDRYDQSKKITTFITGIARNKVMQYWQKKPLHDIREDMDELIGQDHFPDYQVEDESEKIQKLRPILSLALDRLSEKEQKLLHMRFYQMASTEEIAHTLDTSIGNIRVIQHRALEKAKKYANQIYERAKEDGVEK